MKNFIILSIILFLSACKSSKKDELIGLSGNALGTTFSIKYLGNKQSDFSFEVDSLIHRVNKSLSSYIPTSDISKINSGDSTVIVDEYFKEVFQKSARIYKETNGSFDPTIGVLVNAWGFGPQKPSELPDDEKIKSLLELVGFNKVKIVGERVIKQNDQTYFDFNAIGKGYAVDVIARFLESNDIENYMVEIGGEVRVRGRNQKDQFWKIAIENPNLDGTRSFATTIELKNESVATSGNYRKYKIAENGKKYVHTINTKTGYAEESDLLSASVISTMDCADVDAYATALMAMGFEESKVFLEKHPEVRAFLIYSDEQGNMQTFQTPNF